MTSNKQVHITEETMATHKLNTLLPLTKIFHTITLGVLFTLFSIGQASAHKFFVTAWVEGDRVYLEAAFGDGSLAHNAEVIVSDEAGTVLLESNTNDQGEFSYKIEQKKPLKIKVKAGMGHQAEALIPLEEIELAFADEAGPEPVNNESVASQATATQSTPAVAAVPGLSRQEIQQIVEGALDKKLRPLIRKLATSENAEKPKLKDILGGIGYIFGLVGVGTYFHCRRKQS